MSGPPQSRALFVTIEGIDGSGKNTQSRLLAQNFARCHSGSCHHTGFPQYNKNFFGGLVKRYLSGEFGDISRNHPLMTALLYSFDRWQSRGALEHELLNNGLVICDRYVESNLAHQGAKFSIVGDFEDFVTELAKIEYEVLRLPRPDITILLDLPSRVSVERTLPERAAEDSQQDIHEEAEEYLEDVRVGYLQLSQFPAACPQKWAVVKFDDENGVERTQHEIAKIVWEHVEGALNL
jgi:dTMP kinase